VCIAELVLGFFPTQHRWFRETSRELVYIESHGFPYGMVQVVLVFLRPSLFSFQILQQSHVVRLEFSL
ncbi:hypothetical protein PMAYCL1PPCAC_29797, partial [Pristionchus mayeri]